MRPEWPSWSTAAWGSHFGFHPMPARVAGAPPAPTRFSPRRTRSSAASPSRRCCMSLRGGPDRSRRGRALRAPSALDQPQLAAAGLAGQRAPRSSPSTVRRCWIARLAASARARSELDAIPGCSVVGQDMVGRPGVAGWDPLRIVIDVRGTGCTGYELAAELRASYDIYVELATHATLVLVLGMGQPVEPLERFTHDFAETVRRSGRSGQGPAIVRLPGPARAPDGRPDPGCLPR